MSDFYKQGLILKIIKLGSKFVISNIQYRIKSNFITRPNVTQFLEKQVLKNDMTNDVVATKKAIDWTRLDFFLDRFKFV